MHTKSKIIATLFFATTITAYADQIYCPDGIHLVNLGVSVQEFTSVCGSPGSTNSSNAPGSAAGYYVWTYTNQHPGYATNPMDGIPAQVAFVIENGKVGAIQQMTLGQSMSAQSFHCPIQTVSVGTPVSQVKLFCGQPSSIQQLTHIPSNSNQVLPETTTLQYQKNSISSSYSFLNGKLMGKN